MNICRIITSVIMMDVYYASDLFCVEMNWFVILNYGHLFLAVLLLLILEGIHTKNNENYCHDSATVNFW